jgi:phosphate transport system permease protein
VSLTILDEQPVPDSAGGATPRRLTMRRGLTDRVFRNGVRGSGITVLLIMLLVGCFLALRAGQALSSAGWRFFTTQAWDPEAHHFGVAAILFGTVMIGLVAVSIAFPLALGTSVYLSEYAPPRLRRGLIAMVDLMAAVPSIVFGLWGLYFLQPHVVGVARWLSTYLGWIPLLSVKGADPRDPLSTATVYTSSTFIAGIVVALMVTPIATSIMREAFSQAPVGEREGAYALGATRWGMIRSVVLPFGKGGIIGGTMLGLGRALGETIAVFMIISPVFEIQPHILQNGAISVSSLIALRYGESQPFSISALMAAGLALFLLTLVVNFFASVVVQRSRSGQTSDV